MLCQRCQFQYDEGDAYCRKCGASLAQEVEFNEVAPESAEVAEASVETVEIIDQAQPNSLQVVEPNRTQIILEKMRQAITSEAGQKLVKSAAVLAVGLAADIMTQAAERRKISQSTRVSPLAKAIDSAIQPDNFFSRSEKPVKGKGPQSYFYYYERVIVRKIMHRDS